MWIEILKFAGFGFFWFVMEFLAILLNTGQDATPQGLKVNYLIFIGVPLLILLGYKIYSITKNDLSFVTELTKFLIIVVLPLILATLYIKFGDRI